MGYDQEFYERYERYLTEAPVRSAHGRMLRIFSTMENSPHVVDLGCGRSQEFRRFGDWESYIGFDAFAEDPETPLDPRPGDYRNGGFVDSLKELPITAFVSLFSTEITASANQNTELYRQLFSSLDDLRWGLVSGFYYISSKNVNPVGETGGVTSWQTLHALEDQPCPEFDEYRIDMKVPSAMFGEDVVEVWRIFQRKSGTR